MVPPHFTTRFEEADPDMQVLCMRRWSAMRQLEVGKQASSALESLDKLHFALPLDADQGERAQPLPLQRQQCCICKQLPSASCTARAKR